MYESTQVYGEYCPLTKTIHLIIKYAGDIELKRSTVTRIDKLEKESIVNGLEIIITRRIVDSDENGKLYTIEEYVVQPEQIRPAAFSKDEGMNEKKSC